MRGGAPFLKKTTAYRSPFVLWKNRSCKDFLLIIKMDIVIEQVPEVPEQPQLQREVTGQFEDTQEQPDLTATQEDLPNPIEPPPKRRGRPPWE